MKEYIFSRPDEAEDTVKRDANYRGELIRCKDCKFWETCIICKTMMIMGLNGYCGNAKRKENEDE